MKKRIYLAVDLGASSGRVMAGSFDGSKLALEEVHRFPNGGCRLPDGWHWQVVGLFAHIKEGFAKAGARYGRSLVSAGVDTWGVDYGLVDRKGRLLGVPYMYRDERTDGMPGRVNRLLPRAKLYGITGIQSIYFNTLYQLYAEKLSGSSVLDRAHRILFTPDLLNYWLSGRMANEYTIASTSQLLEARTGRWSKEVIRAVGLPEKLFGKLVAPGTVLGPLLPALQDELGIKSMNLVATASHDTASAVAAVPSTVDRFAYLSSGTWSLLGAERATPLLDGKAMRFNFTNEGGVDKTIRLLKNITGLWLIQECRRIWNQSGRNLGFTDIAAEASKARPFAAVIDPDDPMFATPGDMPSRIRDYCRKTGQKLPAGDGQVARVVYESLALRYRQTFDMLEQLEDTSYDRLHVVGGGSQNVLLNQMTADALGKPVVAGPAEATAIGNILVQMIAAGDVGSLREGRELVRSSFDVRTYEPRPQPGWNDALARFVALAS